MEEGWYRFRTHGQTAPGAHPAMAICLSLVGVPVLPPPPSYRGDSICGVKQLCWPLKARLVNLSRIPQQPFSLQPSWLTSSPHPAASQLKLDLHFYCKAYGGGSTGSSSGDTVALALPASCSSLPTRCLLSAGCHVKANTAVPGGAERGQTGAGMAPRPPTAVSGVWGVPRAQLELTAPQGPDSRSAPP